MTRAAIRKTKVVGNTIKAPIKKADKSGKNAARSNSNMTKAEIRKIKVIGTTMTVDAKKSVKSKVGNINEKAARDSKLADDAEDKSFKEVSNLSDVDIGDRKHFKMKKVEVKVKKMSLMEYSSKTIKTKNVSVKLRNISLQYVIQYNFNIFFKNLLLKSKEDSKRHICDICDESFSLKSNLIRHIRNHIEETRYDCKLCNKRFASREGLKRHAITHTGERPYKCQDCDKAFAWKDSLRKHLKIHTGERNFQCKYCDKSFTWRKSLVAHTKSHIEKERSKKIVKSHKKAHNKKETCHICKAILHKRSLARHLLTHTTEKRFKCDCCEKMFTRKDSLLKHRQNHQLLDIYF